MTCDEPSFKGPASRWSGIQRTSAHRPDLQHPLPFSMDFRLLFVASALLVGASLTISLAETISSCKIKWLFGIPCQDVYGKLVNQIKTWQISQSCLYAGERCSYELVSTAPYLITATHTSPSTRKVTDLQFLFEQSTICKVTGEAISELTKDPTDNSTNYCSLQNLMDGSDLVSAAGYSQYSNKYICPGFDVGNCSLF